MTRYLLALALTALVSCARETTAPADNLDGLPAGLDVQFVVNPGAVHQRGAFATLLNVTNTTADTIRVVTAHGCLAIPRVIRNGARIPFKGSAGGCTAAITTHVLAPGAVWSRTWEMHAELYAQEPGDADGTPAAAGMYRVQAEFDTFAEDGPTQKPTIERPLRVR